MEIALDPNTFTLSKSGNVVGEIWIEIAGQQFPERSWSDFVSVLLSWWALEWERFSEKESRSAKFEFMDGPFQLEISKKEPTLAELTLVERRPSKKRTIGVETISMATVGAALLTAVEQFIRHTDARNWTNKEIEALRAFVKRNRN